MLTRAVFAAALVGFWCSLASAQFQAYSDATGGAGTQDFGGALGLDFTVNSDVTLSQLGVFDNGADGPSKPIYAEIWTRSGNTGSLVARMPFTPTSPGALTNGFLMKSLNKPLTLAPGDYSVVAHGLSAPDQLANVPSPPSITDDGGGLLTFVGSGRFGTTVGAFPGTPDGGPAARYHAGSFVFDAAAAPAAALPAPIVIDNGDAGYSTNAWSEQGGVGDAFNSNQGFNSAAGNAAASAVYTFDNLEDGAYEVLAAWRQFGQSNVGEAQYDLDGQITAIVDQHTSAGGPIGDLAIQDTDGGGLVDMAFQSLGEVIVDDGELQVTLGLAPGNTGFVLSDAVAIRPVPSQAVPEPAAIAIWCLLGMTTVGLVRWRRGRRFTARRV